MTSFVEIAVVVALVVGALAYLSWKGYQRITSRAASCGGCAGACGSEPATDQSAAAQSTQMLSEIHLLTPITAADRRA